MMVLLLHIRLRIIISIVFVDISTYCDHIYDYQNYENTHYYNYIVIILSTYCGNIIAICGVFNSMVNNIVTKNAKTGEYNR